MQKINFQIKMHLFDQYTIFILFDRRLCFAFFIAPKVWTPRLGRRKALEELKNCSKKLLSSSSLTITSKKVQLLLSSTLWLSLSLLLGKTLSLTFNLSLSQTHFLSLSSYTHFLSLISHTLSVFHYTHFLSLISLTKTQTEVIVETSLTTNSF